MNKIKQLPYGVSDFEYVMRENFYYVDKTMYIPQLEAQPNNLMFIRPRRFGKSLLLSMLKTYYDKAKKDQFEEIFGSLWIGKHPTPLMGRYQVMHLDFSQIGGSIDELEKKFDEYLCFTLDDFVNKYANDYPDYFIKAFFECKTYTGKLIQITTIANRLRIPMYLIIDEYDNFTNVVLSEKGEEVYHKMTHAEGFYRDVFKKFKGTFERIFFTGVSPVTLDDLTSGFNIGWNISTLFYFDKMLGFSTDEVREMFKYYKEAGLLPDNCDIEAMIEEMKPWYDNYCFAKECLKDGNRVFNSDMVLFYLRNYVMYKSSPEVMLDPNTKTDYNKLRNLIQLDRLDGDRKGILRKIAEEGEIVAEVLPSFPAYQLIRPRMFVSLLFYYGMLTIKGMRGARPILSIPNNNVRMQYYNFLMEEYDRRCSIEVSNLQDGFDSLAFDGEWRSVMQYMCDCYKQLSSVRDSIEGERNIQGFFMAYLSLCNYYIIAPELELQHGYCDFFLLPNMTHYQAAHSYILELKYLSKSDYSDEKSNAQWNEAVEQIKGYAIAPRVEALRQGTQLHKIIIQFCGWEAVRMEEII
ncbi:MAG: ATP-binding protein [Bacteroidales bacterium]|nr:ATP-binding protein [Bacteroidales bacterium]